MILSRVKIVNFGPYRREQEVQFPDKLDRDLMIIYGENMRGKTSFLNAIRWCLYGEALGRSGKPLPYSQLTNYDARSFGDYKTVVSLEFEHEGSRWHLRRSMDRTQLIADPRHDDDYKVSTLLERDGMLLPESDITYEINRMLPKAVARFFLFDGELLQEYEELVTADSRKVQGIKQAIESILGMPSLLRARDELAMLFKKAQLANANELKTNEKAQGYSKQFESESASAASLETDIAELRGMLSGHKDQKAHLDDEIEASEALLDAKLKKDAAERRLSELEDRRVQLDTERLGIVGGAWQDLLQRRVFEAVRLAALREKERADTADRRRRLSDEIAAKERSLAKLTCSLCNQPLSGSVSGTIQSDIEALQSALAALPIGDDEEPGAKGLQIPTIVGRDSQGRLVDLRNRLADTERQISACETDLKALNDEIAGRDTEQIAAKRRVRDRLFAEIQRLENETIPKQEALLAQAESKIRSLSRLMGAIDDVARIRSTVEVRAYDSLNGIFFAAIDKFREVKRERVSQRASAAFKRLSTEETFRSLEINENYGLRIVDREGRYVDTRSAGAEEIVALSLIEALNAESQVEGPMIMDTPFGRLDKTHRARVLESASTLAPQVAFLVHSGEIDLKDIYSQFGHRIGEVYQIERISSSESALMREVL